MSDYFLKFLYEIYAFLYAEENIQKYINNEYMKNIIFTDVKNIFSALEFTKLQNQIIK